MGEEIRGEPPPTPPGLLRKLFIKDTKHVTMPLWWSLIDFFFRLLYNELAWAYDLVSWLASLGRWRTWQRTAISHLRGQRVLELACGTGHLQLALAAAGYEPWALDLSPSMVRITRRRLCRAGLPLRLVRGRAQNLPFPDEAFDSLVSTFPAPFILDPDTLSEARRVLRPGGRLVIVSSAQLLGRDPLSRLLELAYRLTGQRRSWPAQGTPFCCPGMTVQIVEECVAHSQVRLVVMEKAFVVRALARF